MTTALALIAVLVGLLIGLARGQRERRMQLATRAVLGLRRVQRHLQSAQFRSHVKADAVRLRRDLDQDMSDHDTRDGERYDR